MNKLTVILLLACGLGLTACNNLSEKNADTELDTATYSIKGWNPGSDFKKKCNYTGTGTIEKKVGNSYFIAKLNKNGKNELIKRYDSCLYNPTDKILSLTWTGNDKTEGCDIFYKTKNGFEVDWVYFNKEQGKLGKEIWIRK
jgi:hypothetical protein